MTAPELAQSEDVLEFLRRLPHKLRNDVNSTTRLHVLVVRAIRDQGWTVDELVDECTRNRENWVNPGGVVMHRLERCSTRPRTEPRPSGSGPLCGHCDHGWVYSVPDDPAAPVQTTRCPCRLTSQEART